jgi:hypothetical protein
MKTRVTTSLPGGLYPQVDIDAKIAALTKG